MPCHPSSLPLNTTPVAPGGFRLGAMYPQGRYGIGATGHIVRMLCRAIPDPKGPGSRYCGQLTVPLPADAVALDATPEVLHDGRALGRFPPVRSRAGRAVARCAAVTRLPRGVGPDHIG
jgi:hypothetical protein